MRRWISRFSRKEELIFIGDETLVLAARDILTKTKTDVQTSESTSSRLPVKVNHVNIPASFQPGFVVKKDGEGGGSANSLWVVLCNIDKHSEGNIPGDLVEDLCAYGKSVLWLTGMWKLYPDDTIQSTSSRPSYSSREVGGSDIDTANESSDERVASPPPVIGSSSSARAETKNNGDMNTYNDTNSPTPSQDDRDKSKRSSVSGPQAQSSSPIVTPFARDSSSSRDIGSSDTPYILQDKVADFADGNMNDGSSNKRTYTNPRISTTQAHGTAAPPTQRGAQDETTGGRNAHSSEYENNLTQPPHKAQSYSFETRRAFTSSPTMTPSSSPPSPIESSFETDHYTFASLRSEMGSTLSFGGAFGGGNKDYSENTPTDNDRPETSASSTIEEAEAQASSKVAISPPSSNNPPQEPTLDGTSENNAVEKDDTQHSKTGNKLKTQTANTVSSQVARKQYELKLRNQILKPSLKKGARYFRWSDDKSLRAALEALMKRKEGDLVKRRESPHGVSLAGHGPATEVQDSLELSEDDFIIAVMGPTGAGKSTFIRNATGYDKLEIGDDLESCTSEIHVIRFGDSDIYIVDTPGFNDTNRTDLDIFKLISEWLEKRFTNQVYLSGLIYLHRISDNRMGGTTLKNFQIFEKLCGKDCFHKVTLATTMWDDVDEDTGKERERQLRDDYFSYVVRNGARFERLQNSPESAKGLIEEIINDATDLRPLSLQKELVAYNKDLRHTDAGRKMYDKLDDVLRSHHAALQQLNRDLRTEKSEQVQILLKKEHEELTQELMALIADMQYMQLGLPTRLRNFIAGVVGKK